VFRPDYSLAIAVTAPLLIWPWVPAWDWGTGPAGFAGVAMVVALVPIAEEIVFRGFLQGGLLHLMRFTRKFLCLSFANWATSLIFASAHGWQHPLSLLPGYFLVSLVFGHFRERYHGLTVPILLHGYYNLGLLLSGG
jgi:membrane protease YdiL (CAAX protease family)